MFPTLLLSQPIEEREPGIVAAVEIGRVRTALYVPMLKESELIGAILLARGEVRPFSDNQIELVQNFAAQAAIAIENAQLLSELRESLQQQTATAEVLKVISSSPGGELEPVFESILENAKRFCQAEFGILFLHTEGEFRYVVTHCVPSEYTEWAKRQPRPLLAQHPHTPLARMARTKKVVHIPDLTADQSYTERDPRIVPLVETAGARTIVVVPMLKEDELVGAVAIFRQETRPFTDRQIELVQNFAAQAVIAIENARLLNELRQRTTDLTERTADLTEALEQQTATSKVLQVISGSQGDLEPVFATMVENAVRICHAQWGNIHRWDGETLHLVASHNVRPVTTHFVEAIHITPLIRKRCSVAW
jgi:GAF domain-containing protein